MSNTPTILSSAPTLSYQTFSELFSLTNWMHYILAMYEQQPGHVLIEVACILVILYLIFRPTYDPSSQEKLSKEEEDRIIEEWVPEPLCPPALPVNQTLTNFVVESAMGPYVKLEGHKEEMLNFASFNYLGLANRPEIKAAAHRTIDKYGVGSCGPRGFYGTIDVHLDLEAVFAKFLGTPEALIYSDGIATAASILPAFAKKGDLIVADEAVNYLIQQGITLSRANVLYFRHNDMDDLQRILADVREKDRVRRKKNLYRKFIVVEGIYQNVGDLVPLDKVIALKKQYKYRVMVDDSVALGVLGARGRGSADHWNIPVEEVDVVCGSMDNALATVGGFCAGSHKIVDHQRLSGAGYCFSASAPPYTVVAAIVGLGLIDTQPILTQTVQQKATRFRRRLRDIEGVSIAGPDFSPLIHIRLSKSASRNPALDTQLLDHVAQQLYKNGVIVTVPQYIPAERVPIAPSLRLCVTSLHDDKDLDNTAKLLIAAFRDAFSGKF